MADKSPEQYLFEEIYDRVGTVDLASAPDQVKQLAALRTDITQAQAALDEITSGVMPDLAAKGDAENALYAAEEAYSVAYDALEPASVSFLQTTTPTPDRHEFQQVQLQAGPILDYFIALPEVAINNPHLLWKSVESFGASTVALVGDIADLADAGTQAAGWGSFQSAMGADYSWGDATYENITGFLDDNLSGEVTLRPGTNDEMVFNGTTTAFDVASILAGGAGLAKMGAKFGVAAAKESIEVAGEVADMGLKRTIVRAATEAIEHADDAAATTRAFSDNAADMATAGFMSRPLTRMDLVKSTLATTAVATGGIAAYNYIENQTGGAVLDTAINGAIESVKAGIASGALNVDNVDEYIDNMSFVADLFGGLDKGLQSQFVRQVMGEPDENDIVQGQTAAVAWLLEPTHMGILMGKNLIRANVADELFTDRDQADLYIAQGLVNDIVENAHVASLGENQVTPEVVRDVLSEVVNNPANYPGVAMILDNNPRLLNGLGQMWPAEFGAAAELAAVAQPAASPASVLAASFSDNGSRVVGDVSAAAVDAAGPGAQFALLLTQVSQWFDDLLEDTGTWLLEQLVKFAEAITGWDLDGQGNNLNINNVAEHEYRAPAPSFGAPAPTFG